MNLNRRTEDLTQIFDKRWNANKVGLKNQIAAQQNQINKMFDAKQEKPSRRQDILYQNSINGQVNTLNERMSAMQNNRINNFRNGLK